MTVYNRTDTAQTLGIIIWKIKYQRHVEIVYRLNLICCFQIRTNLGDKYITCNRPVGYGLIKRQPIVIGLHKQRNFYIKFKLSEDAFYLGKYNTEKRPGKNLSGRSTEYYQIIKL